MKRTATWAMALAAFASVSSVRAHHSVSMFDIGTPIWVKGTVVRLEPVNPHVVFVLEQTGDDGHVRRWTVEGPGLNSFNRMGLGHDFLQAGDVIEACGFAVKEEVLAQSSGRDVSRPAMHGHVLVMPDGQMRLFGGYGKTENCIRPGDQIETWVSFLDTDHRAREVWCNHQVSSRFPSVAPTAFVDEVNRLLSNPCRE